MDKWDSLHTSLQTRVGVDVHLQERCSCYMYLILATYCYVLRRTVRSRMVFFGWLSFANRTRDDGIVASMSEKFGERLQCVMQDMF
jgi:hypothetical protein